MRSRATPSGFAAVDRSVSDAELDNPAALYGA
jgi:hypothetical protein